MTSTFITPGDIFTNKRSLSNGGGVKALNPKPGDTGWMYQGNDHQGKPTFCEMVFDKGGTARKTRNEGGAIFADLPGWVTLAEHTLRKEARSRFWQKSSGPGDWKLRHARFTHRDWRGPLGMYGGDGLPEHPHAFA